MFSTSGTVSMASAVEGVKVASNVFKSYMVAKYCEIRYSIIRVSTRGK